MNLKPSKLCETLPQNNNRNPNKQTKPTLQLLPLTYLSDSLNTVLPKLYTSYLPKNRTGNQGHSPHMFIIQTFHIHLLYTGAETILYTVNMYYSHWLYPCRKGLGRRTRLGCWVQGWSVRSHQRCREAAWKEHS